MAVPAPVPTAAAAPIPVHANAPIEDAARASACAATADGRQTMESIQLASCLRYESQRVASGQGNSNKSQTNGRRKKADTETAGTNMPQAQNPCPPSLVQAELVK